MTELTRSIRHAGPATVTGRWHKVPGILAALVVMSLAACQQPTTHSDPIDAKVTELAPESTAASTSPALGPQVSEPAGPKVPTLICQRLVFERNAPRLAMALGMLKPIDVDPAVADRWAANGLRIGRLPRGRLPLLMANVPKPLASEIQRLQHATRPAPVTLVDRAEGVQRIRYVQSPGGRANILRFVSGQMQLRLKIEPPLDPALGPTRLELVPHHFNPGPSVLPRSPQEKLADGTSFMDLRLAPPLNEQDVWLIWADLPPLPAPSSDEHKSRPLPSRDPVSLGEAMLTGQYHRRPVQSVLIVGTER